MSAPSLHGRLYYLLGGTLPLAHRDWVYADLTGPRWRLRSALRSALLALPFAVVFLLLPGALDIRVTIAVFLLGSAAGMNAMSAGYLRNRRLVAHGFAPILPREEDEDDGDDPLTGAFDDVEPDDFSG